MSEENKYMDDSFKKMSEDLNVSYNKSFWQDAQANLENDALDEAFRNAAGQAGTTAGVELAAASLEDVFMDDAFQDAAAQVNATYSTAHWEALQAAMPNLQMDDAFSDAAKELKASYSPVYWGAVNSALEQEGLHYEYNSAYWNEAKTLLDSADRKSFFTKWTGVAALLLLISMLGVYGSSIGDEAVSGQRMSNGLNTINENRVASLNTLKKDHNFANGLLTDNYMSAAKVFAGDNENIAVLNEGKQENNFVADNNPVLSNNENDNPTIALGTNNGEVDLNESNNSPDLGFTQEEINLSVILPNPMVELNEENTPNPEENNTEENQTVEGNNYNPLDRGIQNIGLTNLSQRPEQSSLETNVSDVARSNRFIDRMALPSSLIEFEALEMPTDLLATIEAPKSRNTSTFSILAGIGKGIGYGSESVVWTNRYYGGLAYNTQGYGKLRKFEFGVNVMLNYSDHEDLKQEKIESFYLANTTTETEYVKVNVSQLYYLNANVNTSYEFLPKHKLRLGMGLSKAVHATSNVASNFRGVRETEDYVYLKNKFDISNGNNQIPEGLKYIDMSITLGYEFQITRKFSLQVTGKYGLFDRTNDLNFQNNSISSDYQTIFDNERNVTIGLKYNLFRGTK